MRMCKFSTPSINLSPQVMLARQSTTTYKAHTKHNNIHTLAHTYTHTHSGFVSRELTQPVPIPLSCVRVSCVRVCTREFGGGVCVCVYYSVFIIVFVYYSVYYSVCVYSVCM